jgi:hypothetical protein
MPRTLRATLLSFDGTHTDVLEAVAAAGLPAKLRELFALAADPEAEVPATWLLLRAARDGAAITPAQARAAVALLSTAAHWQARLHVLQMFEHIECPARQRPRLLGILRACVKDANGFVRAWAYSAMAGLAAHMPAEQTRIGRDLARAASEETPAVRARLRRITGKPRSPR